MTSNKHRLTYAGNAGIKKVHQGWPGDYYYSEIEKRCWREPCSSMGEGDSGRKTLLFVSQLKLAPAKQNKTNKQTKKLQFYSKLGTSKIKWDTVKVH